MRILALADEESKYLWDYYEKSKLENIDLILSCGDLAPQYLSFLATFAKAPVLYVHGNHDGCYKDTPPEGCVCIDDMIYEYQGIRILGLGGCQCYNFGDFQYTEKEMQTRYRKLKFKIRRKKGIDILLTHAPAYQMNDGEDLPHRGFQCFTKILDEQNPKLFIHGHVHKTYSWNFKRETMYNDTKVVNAYERHIIEL